jgi:hypothetical protein
MTDSRIARKLQIKPGQRVKAVNPPGDYAALLGGLPEGARVVPESAADAEVVHVFVRDQAELGEVWPAIAAALRPDTTLWTSYPKAGPGVETDINRDRGWAIVRADGFDPVSQVAIDDRWSALRWRRDPALRAARDARGARVGRD